MGQSIDEAATTVNVTSDGQPLINMTIKLGSLFSFPSRVSRVLASIRAFDGMMEQDAQNAFGGTTGFDGGSNPYVGRTAIPPGFVPLPGPWRFVTSGYALALLVMAVLLNRIQNVVVPPRHSFAYRLSRNYRNQQTSRFRRIYYSILPLDFSSTFARLIFRIPTLYFLLKALIIWTVILLQTAGLFPSWQWSWLIEMGNWAAGKEMEEICWSSFCAVCGALCVGALTRGLEGAGASANTSPFNLFGYAFILHIYSSPITHITKIQGTASRPDMHVVFTMIMPLLQLTMIHMLGVNQRWSHQRLIPTSITSILSLVHFHTVLWFSPSSYPLLNYVPCLFETGLTAVTLLTIALNALTQLLLEGSITRPLFGHQATLLPKWDEDFSIVLLRLGTASLEATSVAGLGNEVGGVTVSETTVANKPHTEYGSVEINRFGVTSISNTMEGRGRRRKLKEGFANEIKNIKASSGEGELWVNSAWYRELVRFGVSVGKFAKGLWRLAWDGLRGRVRRRSQDVVAPGREGITSLERMATNASDESDEPDIYDRFLRGETVTDDEEEYEPTRRSRTASVSGTPSTMSDDNDESETVGLYADLSSAASTSTSAPVLLAHMTDTAASPLTRRRYSRLVAGEATSPEQGSVFDDWSKIIDDRRSMFGSVGTDGLAESRRNCVICTVEPRQIICWPCRCLALCDDCRENLATRSSASKHTCPCCRRNVEGYSKIFIP